MRIIEPSQFKRPLRKKRPLRGLLLVTLIILLAGYSAVSYAKPLPGIVGQFVPLVPPTLTPLDLQWPSTGQAAFGAVGYGVLAQSGAQTNAPMASIAKVMTALTVLDAKQLKPGETGPTITINDADIQSYHDYVALGGSVVPVNLGETISQYQALQALLLPSANNMADTLVRWAFGSTDTYLKRANQLAVSLQLKQTHIADASGFSDETKSTPNDLVLLGVAALNNPVIAEIVRQKTAVIPVAGEITNTNDLLGQNGINGIKTGSTEQAGGCLLFSSVQSYPNGQQLILVGAVMGARTLFQAELAAATLLKSAVPGFRVVLALRRQTVVGTYKTDWDGSAAAVVNEDVNVLVWSAQPPGFKLNLSDIKVPISRGSVVGSLTITTSGVQKTLPIILRDNLEPPPFSWRINHFFQD